MRIEPTLSSDSFAYRAEVAVRPDPVLATSLPPPVEDAPAAQASQGSLRLSRLIGDVDIRNLSPRQMAETSLDLYVAGILPWDEYAMLAFQPELHPDYDKTIGALTGEKAQPDKPRDFLTIWEERLQFEQKYNGDNPDLIARTQRIVQVFRLIDSPTNLLI